MPNDEPTQLFPTSTTITPGDWGSSEWNSYTPYAHRPSEFAGAQTPGSVMSVTHLLHVLSLLILGGFAFEFRDSAYAAIPMVGLVLYILLWPAYDKFHSLSRVEAQFRPTKGIFFGARSDSDRSIAELKSQVTARQLEVEIARLDKELRLFAKQDQEPRDESSTSNRLPPTESI